MAKTFDHRYKQVFEKVKTIHINNLIKSKDKKTYWFGLSSTQLIYYVTNLVLSIEDKKNQKRINALIKDYDKRNDKINFKRSFIRKIYFVIKNFIYSTLFFYKKKIYVLGNIDSEINAYTKENSLSIIKIDPWININLKKFNYIKKDKNLENSFYYYVKDLCKIFKINRIDKKKIEFKIKKKFYFYYDAYSQMILLYKNKTFDLITTKHVFIWNRIFIGALNYLGKSKTITVNHGFAGITNMKPSLIDDGGFIGSSQLLTTKHYLKNYKEIFKELKFSKKLKPIYLKKNPVFSLIEKKFNVVENKSRINKKKEKIIILGYPKTVLPDINSPYQSISLSSNLEIDLINCLKKKYDVYYNSHPDRRNETKKLFKDIPNILYEKYEDIYQEFDISFFTYHRCTAFGYALLKSVPCVMIYNKESEMTNLTKNYLRKRVSFVNTITTNKPNIIFDKNKIFSSVEKSKKLSKYDLFKSL
tara:strand:- start:6961 stop:8379 length:1419 start_codon:yes stop_codon:yes gene_type:complete